MCVQNLKFVALPVPEIIRGTEKISAVPGYAHAHFSIKLLMGFCSDGTLNVPAKFEFRSFTRFSEIIGVTQKIWTVPGYVHAPFSQNF